MASKALDDVVLAAEAEEAALLPKKQSLLERLMWHSRNHKMLSYAAVNGLFGGVATAIGYAAGTFVPVEELTSRVASLEGFENYARALVMVASSTLTKVAVDLTAPQPLLYLVNKDLYEGQGRWKEFLARYIGFSVLSRAVEGATGVVVTASMLTHGVPLALTAFANGKLAAPFNVPANFFLYHFLVLKENPLPKVFRAVGEATKVVQVRVKDVAYTAAAYLPTFPLT